MSGRSRRGSPALAIEPMLTLGRRYTRVLDDDWTVVTVDGSRAAHFEHSIAVTADGPLVLTAPPAGEQTLRPQERAVAPDS